MKWLELVPGPRPRPEPSGPFADVPIEWDAFISYRSVNRPWALALHDQLAAAKYAVFLDQFVLRPGLNLPETLETQLTRSAAGVLVLSRDTSGSSWVSAEYRKMLRLKQARANTKFPFYMVIARIDNTELPFEIPDAIYCDFANGYEDGPRGEQLIRLVHGLVNEPVADATVRTLFQLDQDTSELLHRISAAAAINDVEEIKRLGVSETDAASESPFVAAGAAQALISIGKEQCADALGILELALKRFPQSLRLQQLKGLALRRLERVADALQVFSLLYVQEHRDPETMGIFAATLMARYAQKGDRADLERARALYFDAFQTSPTNEYVGINAASKSAFLGELEQARELAKGVQKLVHRYADASDFYKALTLAEALVLLGDYGEAESLYRKVNQRFPERKGDWTTTREQLERLITALNVPAAAASGMRAAAGVPTSA